MEFEMLDEILKIEKDFIKGKWATPLKSFLESDKGTILYSCANEQEIRNGISAIGTINKKYHLGLTYGRYKGNKIYVVKGK